MPALYLFGTRTLLGGDDLQVPCCVTLMGRLFQCLFLILPLAVYLYMEYQQQQQQQQGQGDDNSNGNWETSTCHNNQRMNAINVYPLLSMIWVTISFAFCLSSILVEIQLWYWSCQGTPTTIREPRTSHVRRWMQIKLISTTILLTLLSVLFFITSTGFAKQYHICHQQQEQETEQEDASTNNNDVSRWVSSQSWYILGALLFVTQLMECILTTLILARLTCPCSKRVRSDHSPWNEEGDGIFLSHDHHRDSSIRHSSHHHHHHHERMEELWARRCMFLFRCLSFCTCFVFGGKDLWMIPTTTRSTNTAPAAAATTDYEESANNTNTATTTIINSTHNGPFGIYQQVAQVLADYMETGGTLDVVPTDWVTGLLVLQRLQRHKILQSRRHPSLGFLNDDHIQQEQKPLFTNTIAPMTSSDQPSSESSLLVPTSNNYASSPPATATSAATVLSLDHPTSLMTTTTGLRSRNSSANDLLFSNRAANNLTTTTTTHDTIITSPTSSSKSWRISSQLRTKQRSKSTPPSTPPSNTSLVGGGLSPTTNTATTTTTTVSSTRLVAKSNYSSTVTSSSTKTILLSTSHRIPQQPVLPPHSHVDDDLVVDDDDDNVVQQQQQQRLLMLEEAARMAKYALAIYTWMLYLFVNPCTGMPALSYRSCCHSGDCNDNRGRGGGGGCRSRCCCCRPRRWNRQSTRRTTTTNQHSSFPVSSSPVIMQRQSTKKQQQSSLHRPRNSSREHDLLEHCHDNDDFHQFHNRNDNHLHYENDKMEDDHDNGIEDNDVDDPYDYDPPPGADTTTTTIASTILGDTFCQWHKHALLSVAGLVSDHDLIYAQFQNTLSFVPYCILLDHEHSLVVLSIRGSLSLEDIVTDTLVQPEPLDRIGRQYGFDGNGQYCHAGVLSCFETILQDLYHHGWLDRLLLQEYPTYQLRIVGHSLGAGVAVLLSYVLRWKFPTLHVYSFSPPGCTMTWKMATDCIPWTTSFVLDNDIVPRLSVLALENLRDEVLELIGRIKVPKYKVFDIFLRGTNGRKGCLFRNGSGAGVGDGSSSSPLDGCDDEEELEDLTHILHDILDDTPQDTLYNRQVQEFFQVQHNRKETRGEKSHRHILFYPPGRMIHLVKTKTATITSNGQERKYCSCFSSSCSQMFLSCTTCCYGSSCSGFTYTPVYIANDGFHNEIVVHGTMGTDHFIDRMCEELQKVAAATVAEEAPMTTTKKAAEYNTITSTTPSTTHHGGLGSVMSTNIITDPADPREVV